MPIHTVLGEIDPAHLGPTSMHEHVFADLRLWAKSGEDGVPWDGPIGPKAQMHLRWNGLHTPDNLHLHDPRSRSPKCSRLRRRAAA
jgi:phosphotriesterase-related protein